MIYLAPSLLKQSSGLQLHIVSLIFDNVVDRPVDSVRLNVNQIFIIYFRIPNPPIAFGALRNIPVTWILVKIPEPIFHVVFGIILKPACNVFMESSPVLPVQEKHADSD